MTRVNLVDRLPTHAISDKSRAEMQMTVKKWGNSAPVRFPTSILRAAGLRIDAAMDIYEENGRISMMPLPHALPDLQSLIDCITPENVHTEVDFGRPVGREAL